MKILSAKINADGHTEIFVEYDRTVTVRDTAIIPSRAFLIAQGQKDLENKTDDQYMNDALEKLRSQYEDVVPVAAAVQSRADALVGLEVTKKA